MKQTPHFAITYPEGSDPAKNLAAYFAQLATQVDNVMYGLDPDNPVNPTLAARVGSLEARLDSAESALMRLATGSGIQISLDTGGQQIVPAGSTTAVAYNKTLYSSGGLSRAGSAIQVSDAGLYLVSVSSMCAGTTQIIGRVTVNGSAQGDKFYSPLSGISYSQLFYSDVFQVPANALIGFTINPTQTGNVEGNSGRNILTVVKI